LDPSTALRRRSTHVSFWQRLRDHHRANATDYYHANVTVTPEAVCTAPPSWEGGAGAYALLTEKIRVEDSSNNHNRTKLLCALYTHSRLHNLAVTAALTWGAQCDGFLAFTNDTATEKEPFMVHLPHAGPESYHNMWQKTRSIFQYLHQYHRSYDWFHLSGDDVFVLVPNLRRFVAKLSDNNNNNVPMLAGQWIRQKNRPYVGGGPGYTFNRAALEWYVGGDNNNKTTVWDTCFPDTVSSAEDRLLSQCLLQSPRDGGNGSGVTLVDTRQADTWEQRYHDVGPQQVYEGRMAATGRRRANFHSRAEAYWERLPRPGEYNLNNHNRTTTSTTTAKEKEAERPLWKPVDDNDNTTRVVGPKPHLQAAASDSVSFHKIHHPVYMVRLFAILYPGTCPPDSPLERHRRQQQQLL